MPDLKPCPFCGAKFRCCLSRMEQTGHTTSYVDAVDEWDGLIQLRHVSKPGTGGRTMNLIEGALYFGALAFFFYWGFKSGELRGMEYRLFELQEELNDEN